MIPTLVHRLRAASRHPTAIVPQRHSARSTVAPVAEDESGNEEDPFADLTLDDEFVRGGDGERADRRGALWSDSAGSTRSTLGWLVPA